jgi:hypothetical protein
MKLNDMSGRALRIHPLVLPAFAQGVTTAKPQAVAAKPIVSIPVDWILRLGRKRRVGRTTRSRRPWWFVDSILIVTHVGKPVRLIVRRWR